jgi:hypothetical protein
MNTSDVICALATSVEMERKFSQGRLLLSYTCSQLSVESTRAALCLGDWSAHGLVQDSDIKAVVQQPDVVSPNDSSTV